jgi:hypothetical protein
MFGCTNIVDLGAGADLLRRRRYGCIEVVDGRLAAISLRPWPKRSWLLASRWLGERFHRRPGNRCLLYYNQPWGFEGYLALPLALSHRDTTLGTIRLALTALEQIAELKGVEALLCDVVNPRISERLLARWGWQAHAPMRWHRNYVKRLYCQPADQGGAVVGEVAHVQAASRL